MNKQFSELIEGLSRHMEMPLKPEQDKMITLLIEKKLRVHMELDTGQEFFQIISQIADIPPGKFRENVLLYSLIGNVYPYILTGTLAFSEKLGKLILFHNFPMKILTAQMLHEFLPRFIEKGLEWTYALENANSAPSSILQRVKKGDLSNPFGIKP